MLYVLDCSVAGGQAPRRVTIINPTNICLVVCCYLFLAELF
jgi:hypothetical protein